MIGAAAAAAAAGRAVIVVTVVTTFTETIVATVIVWSQRFLPVTNGGDGIDDVDTTDHVFLVNRNGDRLTEANG